MMVRGMQRKIRRDEEEEISREELRMVLKGLREGETVGMDEIQAEVWKYGGEGVEEWVLGICNMVWRGEE